MADLVRVKVCGITNLEDAWAAVEAGADLLGFIFYARSPRSLTPAAARSIVAALRPHLQGRPAGQPQTVGVFVDEPIERVEAILADTGLDLAQLHGSEPAEHLARLAGRGYKALRPADENAAADAAARYAPLGPVDGPAWLIDAYDPAAPGGTGRRADWALAAVLARRHPGLLLAGGLTADNVATAVTAVRPWGVDVASGVEAAPGRKDHAKLRAFLAAAKRAGSDPDLPSQSSSITTRKPKV